MFEFVLAWLIKYTFLVNLQHVSTLTISVSHIFEHEYTFVLLMLNFYLTYKVWLGGFQIITGQCWLPCVQVDEGESVWSTEE